MTYRFLGLSADAFQPFLGADTATLAAQGIRRVIAEHTPGYPCRISLKDAAPGERLLLLSFEHQPAAHSPYRVSGPIYVREVADQPYDGMAWPPVLEGRLLSLRAYDGRDLMVDADVGEGDAAQAVLARLFERPDVAYVHIHNAKRGCFSCKVVRASPSAA